VKALPIVIKILGVVGTIALIMVAGGIFLHRIEFFHEYTSNLARRFERAYAWCGWRIWQRLPYLLLGKGIYSLATKK
jgi:predicted DNA repair protein MutK